MSGEFDESEIIFSDNFFPTRRRDEVNEKETRPVDFRENSRTRRSKTTPLPSPAAFSTSLPVNIPGDMMRRYSEDDEEFDGGRKMIPPHLIDFRENSRTRRSKTTPLPSPAAFSTSLPVNIPGDMMRRYSEDDEEFDGGRKMIPPHLIVGRRMESGQMAFSVCTGNGRTLKGRDLSQVRNSVLRLTGFLEA
ncbi:hypothetical protein Bca4012_062933 [Brassica carinata]|uniref:Senescence regulator n=1 Tax=Brassica carinata TaxID=52824 RepID=A0A8X7V6E4_BRACI|nr:hypothetical protein Bca52824_032553 [Brassica carinata]